MYIKIDPTSFRRCALYPEIVRNALNCKLDLNHDITAQKIEQTIDQFRIYSLQWCNWIHSDFLSLNQVHVDNGYKISHMLRIIFNQP